MLPSSLEVVFTKLAETLEKISWKDFDSWQKKDSSLVTSLDLQLQNRIIDILQTAYPSHNLLYEEGEQKHMGKSSKFTWIIDPIDGTANMAKGKREFGSSIGLMYNNQFIAAIVAFPRYNETYTAVQGTGVFKNGYKFPAIPPGSGRKEIVLCSKSYPGLKQLLRSGGDTVSCYYCATYSMLKVLKGEAYLYHTINTKIYDVGPMAFILSQLGANIYDGSASPIGFRPSLDRIPFFIAAADAQLARKFIANIKKTGNRP